MWDLARKPVVGILLFDQVEVLDFAGPYEVFACARNSQGQRYFDVLTVAERSDVRCAGGLAVVADHDFDSCPALDLLIVPGGDGARMPGGQDAILEFVRRQRDREPIIASVCTGSFLLGCAGLLDGLRATTHSLRLDLFRAEFPQTEAVEEKIVDLDMIMTAAGVSSGIDLALHILERWFGVGARRAEARRLEGPWD